MIWYGWERGDSMGLIWSAPGILLVVHHVALFVISLFTVSLSYSWYINSPSTLFLYPILWLGLLSLRCVSSVGVYSCLACLFLLPGTTSTTVGGVLYLMDEDSSDEEEPSPLLASLGVTVPLSFFVASRVFPPPLCYPFLFYLLF